MKPEAVRVYVFRLVGLLHLIAGVAYLSWRLLAGPGDWGSVLFWLAELYVWLAAVGFTLSRFPQAPQERIPSPETLQRSFFQLPRVDVLVLRQRDSVEATRQTALSALRLSYPWERLFVHIVDRVEDPQMAEVARSIPCDYWACPAPTVDPLAYMLGSDHLQGEYLLLVNPGHFLEPDFLWQTLPLFYDAPERAPIANRTGFVQARLRVLGQMRAVHPLQQLLAVGSHGYQAAPLLGSGCFIRRRALEEIPHLDIRRSVQLGCQIHCRGWRSHLVGATQVTGVLLPLRNRRVALLALFSALRENPFWGKPTTQQQRFQYLWLALWAAGGLAELAYLAVPVLFLCTGWMPVPAFDAVFFAWFLPYAVLGRISWLLAFPRHLWRAAWQSERQTGSQFFQSIQALAQALQGRLPYPEQPSQLSLGPQALAILLTLVAMGVGSLRFAGDWDPPWHELIFGLLWAFYNLAILTARPDDHDVGRLAFRSSHVAEQAEEGTDLLRSS